jgi:hypothetical protein
MTVGNLTQAITILAFILQRLLLNVCSTLYELQRQLWGKLTMAMERLVILSCHDKSSRSIKNKFRYEHDHTTATTRKQ